MEPRVKTRIWVAAYLRTRAAQGAFGAVVRKGDETSGTVLVRINMLDGRSRIFSASYSLDGARIWSPALAADPASDADVDAYIARSVARDADLWVVEVEDPTGDAKLEGF